MSDNNKKENEVLSGVKASLQRAGNTIYDTLHLEALKPYTDKIGKKAAFLRFCHFLLFPVMIIYFELMLRLLCKASFGSFFYPLIFGVGAGLLLAALTGGFKRKTNRTLTLIFFWILTILYGAQCMIYDAFELFFSFDDIKSGLGDVVGGYGGTVVNTIIGSIPVIILFAAPVVLYTIYGKKKLKAYKYQPKFIASMLAAAILLNGSGIVLARTGKSANIYGENFTYTDATGAFGLLTGTRLSIKNTLFGSSEEEGFTDDDSTASTSSQSSTSKSETVAKVEYNQMDLDFSKATSKTAKSITKYVKSQEASEKNDYTGLFKGKNLILICAEALGYGTIDKELTPTLYRMKTKGFNFTKYYQPAWGGSTTTGEYSEVMGLCPRNGVKSMKLISHNNNYFTMGNQLQRLNYYNACYHNGSHTYYDRNKTHTNLGYRKFLAYGNGLDKYTKGGWKGDEDMLSLTLDNYIDKQPFSTYYMTVSGHAAYKKSSKYVKKHYKTVNAIVGNKYKTTTKYYLCYQYELELAMKAVIKKLEDAGIAEDTVIAITTDHYPYGLAKSSTWGNSQDYIKDLYGGSYSNCWGRDKNYLILWSECLETTHKDMQKTIKTPTMSLDILPTLSNLFGVKYDSRLLVGRDVFSDQQPLVFWNNNSWVTERGKYDAVRKKFYPAKGYEDTTDAYINKITKMVKDKRTFSLSVAKTDYYRLLFGKDTKKGKAIYTSSKKSSSKKSSKKSSSKKSSKKATKKSTKKSAN